MERRVEEIAGRHGNGFEAFFLQRVEELVGEKLQALVKRGADNVFTGSGKRAIEAVEHGQEIAQNRLITEAQRLGSLFGRPLAEVLQFSSGPQIQVVVLGGLRLQRFETLLERRRRGLGLRSCRILRAMRLTLFGGFLVLVVQFVGLLRVLHIRIIRRGSSGRLGGFYGLAPARTLLTTAAV